jgi:hypothetical protein
MMRTSEKKKYWARCTGCDRTWSAVTPKAILKAGSAARAHCQQSGHSIRGTRVGNFVHKGGKARASK